MGEKVQVAAKKPEVKRENQASQSRNADQSQSMSSPIERVMFLQRTIGNQAVQKLARSGALQAKLRIGQPGDKYEQEADTVQQRSEGLSLSQKIVQSKSIFFRPSEKAESAEKTAEVKPEVIPEPVPGKKVSEKRVAPDVDSKTAPEMQTTAQTAPKAPTKKEIAGSPRGAGGEKPSVSTLDEENEEKKSKKEPLTKEKEGIGAGEETAEVAPEKPEAVSISAEDPGQILEYLENVTPTSSVASYDEAQKVSAEALENQKQQVEQDLPELPAPTGLPAKKTRIKEKGKVAAAAEKLPSAFEGEKSGKEGEEYKPQVEEAPPPPPIKPTFLGGGEADESGKGDTELSRSAQKELENVHMDASNISTNAGERPAVDMTGEADPSQLDSFRGESGAKVQNAKAEASKEIYQDFGENDIFPEPTDETLKAGKALSSPKKPSGKGGESLSIPPEAIAGLNESLGPVLRERIGEQKEKYDSGKEKFDGDSAKARVDADKQIASLNKETREKQIEEQNNTKAEVAQSRTEWQSELDSVEQDYQEKASKATEEQREKIAKKKQKGEDEAAKHLEDAEKKAEKKKLKAEKEAEKKKKEAKKESKGFWGWVKSAASAVIDGLKKAVNFIYDGLREAVKLIFKVAKALVKAAIEIARIAIVGLIKGFGLILKGLVTVVFAAFPNIARKINSKIDKAVKVAVEAVNTAADLLKKGVEAVLDFLANTLDKLLGLIQSIYNGIFTVIGMIIRGEFMELMEHLGNLVNAAKTMPDQFETAAYEELLGGNLDEPLSPFELAQAGITPPGLAGEGAPQKVEPGIMPLPPWTEENIGVDQVAHNMELSPELANEILGLTENEGEIEFGESTEKTRTMESVMSEVSGQKTDEEKEKTKYPDDGLSPSKRAEVKWKLMKEGITRWWEENRVAIIAGAIAAIVGVIALIIVTGGSILAAIPPLMSVLGPLFIGVTVVTLAGHVRDYFSKAWDGDIQGGGKSLAKGLAAGAIELISWITFKAGGAALKGAKALAKGGIQIAKGAAKMITRGAKFVIKKGKVLFKGIASGVGKQFKRFKDLGKGLMSRLRFRKFKIKLKGHRFQILGFINPWILLADGTIEEVTFKGEGGAKLGEKVKFGRREGIVVGIKGKPRPSKYVQELIEKAGDPAKIKQNKTLFQKLNKIPEDDIKVLLQNRETTYQLRKGIKGPQPPHFQAHHVVPRELKGTRKIKEFLDDIGFNFEDGVHNGIMLPNKPGHGVKGWKNATIHMGSHPNYTKSIAKKLEGLADDFSRALSVGTDPAKVIADSNRRLNKYISRIKNELMNGKVLVN